MGTCLEKHNLPTLTQDVIEKSQWFLSVKEIESSIYNITTKKILRRDGLTGNSPKDVKKKNISI